MLILRSADKPVFDDGKSGNRVEVGWLKRRENIPRANIHSSNAVIPGPVVKDFLSRSLNK
jgi:hypothetical protein